MMGPGPGMGGGGLLLMVVVIALTVIPFWRLLPQFRIPSWVASRRSSRSARSCLWVMAFRDKLDGGRG